MIKEFRLPDLGEGIEGGDVVQVLVKKGDAVAKDQIVVELETDKATVEVPSNFGGTVKQLHVKAGDAIQIDQLLLTIDEGADGKAASAAEEKEKSAPEPEIEVIGASEEKPKPAPTPAPKPEPAAPSAPAMQPSAAPTKPRKLVPASPAVRRFAREIGIDIQLVSGTGPGGRISKDDVKLFSRDQNAKRSSAPATVAAGGGIAAPPLPNFERWGAVEREKMTNIRKTTVNSMSVAWNTIPHVTQHDKADITDLEKLRKSFAPQAEAVGAKLTVTAILIKVIAAALKKFPKFNCSIDPASAEIINKKFYNIGVAVDTERGLLVPVVKGADQMNMLEIAKEMGGLAEKARNKKLGIEEMQGATFTITNLGGIGGTSFTPIVNWPEVAILGVSRGSKEAIFKDGQFEPRLMLPLSLSYDHRIIDGADAARFLRWICTALEQPFMIAVEG